MRGEPVDLNDFGNDYSIAQAIIMSSTIISVTWIVVTILRLMGGWKKKE